jgi:O-antigen/teichoic acid export membrane protein
MSKIETAPRPETKMTAPASSTWRDRGVIGRIGASGFSRIAGISASLVGTQAITSVLGLIFWTLAARVFSISDVGIAGAAVALMTLLGTLGSLGLGTVLIARLPHTDIDERRVLVRTCLAAASAGGVLLGLIVPAIAVHVFGVTALAPIAGSLWPMLGFALGTGLTSAVIVLDQAVLTIGIGALQFERNVTASGVKIVALIAFGALGIHGGMVIFLAWTIGNIISLPLVAWRTRGGRALGRGRRLLEPHLLRGIGKLAVSHHALNVSIQAALQLLPVIVTILISAAANASFNAAIMLAGFVFALPYAVSVGLFAAARGDESEIVNRMRLTIPFGLGVSLAADLVLIPLAGPLLHIFGSTYAADGTILLRLVVLAGIPFVIKDHFIALRRVQGRTTQALAMTSIFLVFELAGAAIGAEVGGVVGLCIGWLGVLVIEALVLAVPLLAVARQRGKLATSSGIEGVPEIQFELLETSVLVESDDVVETNELIDVEAPVATNTGDSKSAELSKVVFWLTEETPVNATPPADKENSRRLPALPGWRARNLTGPTLFVMSLGVMLMAVVSNAGRAGATGTLLQVGWNAGLVIIFAPAALRIVARSTPTLERIVVAAGLGLMLQFSRLVLNPTSFVFHDELIHAETLRQIDQTNHLFAFNPLLPVSSYYPGLEVVTNAVERLTGLAAFPAAAITLMLARLVMVLALVAIIRIVSGSYRAGAVGVLVYVANPQLLFFNSQYSYQTLALPLAVLTIYFFASRRRGGRYSLLLPLATITAVVFTHHLTAVLLIVALAAWLILAVLRARRAPGNPAFDAITPLVPISRDIRDLAVATAWGVVVLGASILNPGNPILSYLGAIGGSSSEQLLDLAGGSKPKVLFSDAAGTGPAPWEQVLLIAAVVIAIASLLIALGYLRKNHRAGRPLAMLLGLVAILYPIIPASHLTSATAEVGDRSAGFVFIGTAVVIGAWWWQRKRTGRAQLIFALGCVVLFLGDVVLGAGPTAEQLPGPYEISADARSVDAYNLAAAEWENTSLPRDSIAYGDRTSGMLASATGGLDTILHVSTNYDASRLLLAPTVTSDDLQLIDQTRLTYLIVDTRLSTGLPHQQFYIESGEYGDLDRKKPVSSAALAKFTDIAGVDRVYDNGKIKIYDVAGLR